MIPLGLSFGERIIDAESSLDAAKEQPTPCSDTMLPCHVAFFARNAVP